MIYSILCPLGCLTGRLCGEAKVYMYKAGCLLRPVTLVVNIEYNKYNLAKWLDSSIKPCIQESNFLFSILSFINNIKELKLRNNVTLMILEATSFFTNDPVDFVIDNITNKLFSSDVAPKSPFLHSKKQLRKISLKTVETLYWRCVYPQRETFLTNRWHSYE